MTIDLPVTLHIIAPSQRDGVPSAKAGEKITIRLTRKLGLKVNVKVDSGTVYIIDPFGQTVSRVPFRFGKTNFGQFILPLKNQLLSGFYTVLVAFQDPKIKKRITDKDTYKGPPENHLVIGGFHLEGGYPPIVIHRVNYQAAIKNTTSSTLNKVQAVIAVPPSLPPRQDNLDFKCTPKFGREQNDLVGNRWIQFLRDTLPIGKTFTCGYTALIRNRATRYNLPVSAQNPPIPGSIEAFTQPENFIESHHHLIKDLARDIAQTSKTAIQFVRAAMKAVTKRMRYVRQKHERGAAYAIEKGVGDCTEYAALFTALCRANRIPARLEAGFAYNNHGWERHAWSQIWIRGQWIPVDPTWHGAMGLLGVTNRHVPLIIGNWMDTRIRQEFKVMWYYQERAVDGKKRKKSEPKIETAWKVTRVVTVPESPSPRMSAAPVEIHVTTPDAVPRGSKLPLDISVIPSQGFNQVDQWVMIATVSEGGMEQVVAIEPLNLRLQSPITMQLKITTPQAAPKVTLNLRLWANQKPTSTVWRKTIGLI